AGYACRSLAALIHWICRLRSRILALSQFSFARQGCGVKERYANGNRFCATARRARKRPLIRAQARAHQSRVQDAKKPASQQSAGARIATRAVMAVKTFLRQLAGGDPVVRLKARLNAASDS